MAKKKLLCFSLVITALALVAVFDADAATATVLFFTTNPASAVDATHDNNKAAKKETSKFLMEYRFI